LRVQSGGLRIADACELIGLHRRQVFRLLRGLKQAMFLRDKRSCYFAAAGTLLVGGV
jgi:hypothetical protein